MSRELSVPPKASIEELRAKVRVAWDESLFQDAATRVVGLLVEHLKQAQSRHGNVLNWEPPVENIRFATETLETNGSPSADRIAALAEAVLQRGQNLNHPRYVGHQVPPPSPLAGLFDAIGAVTNQVMGIYEMGPFTTAIERAVVNKLGRCIGWEAGSFSGVVTHGGSLANLTALLTARNVRLGDSWETGADPKARPCIVANADAHYCVNRAAGIMGIGARNVIPAAMNDRRSVDPAKLDQQFGELIASGHAIIAFAASACSTPTGAFDDLAAIADVCEKHGVWFHVDAAHGGGALMSERYRQRLAGIDRADSVVWDAHKMMFVPALCAFVFFRKHAHGFAPFQQKAPYLFDSEEHSPAEYDSALRTLECTKRAAALGIWGLWSTFGESLFGDLIDLTFGLTRQFWELLKEANDFQPLHEPEANILVFRYEPHDPGLSHAESNAMHSLVRRRLIESGHFYICQTELDSRVCFRTTVINPLTTAADLAELLGTIRTVAADV